MKYQDDVFEKRNLIAVDMETDAHSSDLATKSLLTHDPEMRRILQLLENVAGSRATVLICGESGTGKEMLAKFIHAKSPRALKRFTAINCAAIPGELLESELFGFERGAFTGASQSKPGKFELANGGTFLLDEISEMPLLLQAKLLRVIQEGEIERLGGKTTIKVNVRILATTNRNLQDMVHQGMFREDLFYRLNVIPVVVPPLRDRPKDIEMLSRYFVERSTQLNRQEIKQLSPEAMVKLKQWRWPGNIRELENVIERSVLLSRTQVITPDDVMISGFQPMRRSPELQAGMTIFEVEKQLIYKTLEFTNQNRTRAAQLLGISIRTLRNKLHEYHDAELGKQNQITCQGESHV